MTSFLQWIDDKTHDEWWIYTKRLSANDTGLTGGHGVGIYVPQVVVTVTLPSIAMPVTKNPRCGLKAQVTSHGFPEQTLKATYYNNKHFSEGNRNEHRLTRWNSDVTDNPIQDPANTGALTLFAFNVPKKGADASFLDVWICKNLEEEEFVENQIGEVIPGRWLFDRGDRLLAGFTQGPDAIPSSVAIPPEWDDIFPGGAAIISYLSTVFRFKSTTPDKLIIERRNKEYQLFRQIEERHILHKVRNGFDSVDDFMLMANSVSNRRKSRSGKSLEIHLEHLFQQFGLTAFTTQCETEGKKRPDFIFPSCGAYHDHLFPGGDLRMLAVKTTCKDRWRQILNEADRVEKIHLFTLQEGVSPQQFAEMVKEDVILVVPEPLHSKYPEQLRDKLMTLESFIEDTKGLGQLV